MKRRKNPNQRLRHHHHRHEDEKAKKSCSMRETGSEREEKSERGERVGASEGEAREREKFLTETTHSSANKVWRPKLLILKLSLLTFYWSTDVSNNILASFKASSFFPFFSAFIGFNFKKTNFFFSVTFVLSSTIS